MPPPSALPIVARNVLLTLGARVGPRAGIDGDHHLLPRNIQLHINDGPGGACSPSTV